MTRSGYAYLAVRLRPASRSGEAVGGGSTMGMSTYRATWDRFAKTSATPITIFLALSGCLILASCVFFFGTERPFETEGVVVTGEVFDKGTRMENRSRGRAQLVHFLRGSSGDSGGRLEEESDQ